MERTIYSISYDLRKPGRDYSELYEAIKKLDPRFQHPLESNWFVRSAMSADQIYNQIRPFIDDNDLLLVIAVDDSNKQGWMVRTFWNWINEHKL